MLLGNGAIGVIGQHGGAFNHGAQPIVLIGGDRSAAAGIPTALRFPLLPRDPLAVAEGVITGVPRSGPPAGTG